MLGEVGEVDNSRIIAESQSNLKLKEKPELRDLNDEALSRFNTKELKKEEKHIAVEKEKERGGGEDGRTPFGSVFRFFCRKTERGRVGKILGK